MQNLTDADIKIIGRCPLFRNLDAEELIPTLHGFVSDIPEGTFLVQEGERIDRIWIVLSGTLHASHHTSTGREFLYQLLTPSFLAGGEIACTPRKTCPYCIYAASECSLWSFDWSKVESDQLSPELRMSLIQNMLNFISNQNIQKYYKIEALSVKSARERIMNYLTAQANRSNSSSFYISMDREAMANYLCLNRSVLSHELKKMEADGLLTFYRNHFTLLDHGSPKT